jgi:peptide/nickel transport system ATP-binding protein
MALLNVEGLRIGFEHRGGTTEVVRGVNFTVELGETVGLVGESGTRRCRRPRWSLTVATCFR